MRITQSPLRHAFGLGGAAVLALMLAHCGTDAVGVDACKRIEDKRCDVAPACGAEYADTETCKDFYRDQCLAGVENATHSPSETEVKACEAALSAAAACAKAGKKTMATCPEAPLISGGDTTKTPCQLITQTTHQLSACAFLAAPPVDAGTTVPDTGSDAASTGGGGTGGTGGAGGPG